MGVCNSGQSERILRKRFIQASEGVNTCLPSDSGAQSISSGILTVCSTAAQVASVFALQTWKAICFLWGEIQTLQAQIAIRPIMRTPGALNLTVGAAAGVGATISTTGNDTAGQITLNTGSGVATGTLFTGAFVTPYATVGTMVLFPASPSADPAAGGSTLPPVTTTVSGVTALTGQSALSPSTDYKWNYVVLGGT